MRFIFKYFMIIWLICLIDSVYQQQQQLLEDDLASEWFKWKKEFNKEYSIGRQESLDNYSQEEIRFSIFKDKLAKVRKHNSNETLLFKMGTNEFSDLTDDELNERLTETVELEIIKKNIKKLKKESSHFKRDLTNEINWIDNGVVTPALNQGNCGSCYTFASVAAIESAFAIKNNLKFSQLKQFSQQQLLDCTYRLFYDKDTKSYANTGCKGGYLYYTLTYVFRSGIQLAKDYPYMGEVNKCKYNSNKTITKISGIYTASHDMADFNAMKKAVAKQPIVSHMYVASDFYDYKSGIYSSNMCASSMTDCPKGVTHAVTIVGYGSENNEEYWIVKNSWGPTFGENGFFRIALGKNMCCIEGFTYYPKI